MMRKMTRTHGRQWKKTQKTKTRLRDQQRIQKYEEQEEGETQLAPERIKRLYTSLHFSRKDVLARLEKMMSELRTWIVILEELSDQIAFSKVRESSPTKDEGWVWTNLDYSQNDGEPVFANEEQEQVDSDERLQLLIANYNKTKFDVQELKSQLVEAVTRCFGHLSDYPPLCIKQYGFDPIIPVSKEDSIIIRVFPIKEVLILVRRYTLPGGSNIRLVSVNGRVLSGFERIQLNQRIIYYEIQELNMAKVIEVHKQIEKVYLSGKYPSIYAVGVLAFAKDPETDPTNIVSAQLSFDLDPTHPTASETLKKLGSVYISDLYSIPINCTLSPNRARKFV